MSETVENKVDGPGAEARTSGIRVRVFGRTDVGLVREHNEDNFLIADLTSGNRSILPEVRTHVVGARGSLFAVCDGMGGAAAGEVASRIGVDTIYEMLQDGDPPIDDITLARRLDLAICEAGTRIFTAAKLNRGQRGMGTTSTVAALVGPRLILGQVGDSRAHIVRRGELVQVTKDQSLVQQLIDAKQLTEEEARDFDRSNIILQALGTTEEVHVDVTSVDLRRGDALVMCSDGLSGMVEPEAIRNAVLEFDEPMEACRRLTELACDGGGDDNITVIVARFDGEGLPEPTPEDALGYAKFEYPKTTETTVRAAISRFVKSDAPPKDEGDAVAAAGPAPAADPVPAPQAGGKPEEARGAPAAAPVAEEAPQAGGAKEPPAEEEPPRAGKGGAGVVVGVIAAILVVGGIGGYLALAGEGPGDGPGDAVEAASQPSGTAPAVPGTGPSASPERGDVRPPLPLEKHEEPRLEPIDVGHIVGSGEGGEADGDPHGKKEARSPGSDQGSASGGDESSAAGEKKDNGSGKGGQTSKNEGAAAEGGAEPVKKKPRPKKDSVIEDNPY